MLHLSMSTNYQSVVEEYRKKREKLSCDESVQAKGNGERVMMGRVWMWTLTKSCPL